jgi:hypothetical protein
MNKLGQIKLHVATALTLLLMPSVFAEDSSSFVLNTLSVKLQTSGLGVSPNFFLSTAPDYYLLTVNGGIGGGSYTNQQQVMITANAPAVGKAFDQWTGATQYVANSTAATIVVTMPAQTITLTATYKDRIYTLTANAGANGTALPSSTKVTHGNSAGFLIAADRFYRIAALTTNGTLAAGISFDNNSTAINFTWSNVLADGLLAVTFTAQVASDPMGTPYSWLAQYGLTNFNADAMSDVDLDGLNTWQEYIAGTDPTNHASVLDIQLSTGGSVYEISWYGVSGRYYLLEYTDNIVNGWMPYGAVRSGNNEQMPQLNTYSGSKRFYRIRVSNKPSGFD